MHRQTLFPEPTFITKFLQNDGLIADAFPGQDASLLQANIAQWRAGSLTPSVAAGCRVMVIDPVTAAFTYDFRAKPTYARLPYAPPRVVSANSLLASPQDLSRFTRSVMEFQRDLGAGLFVAPYFYCRDLDDARLTATLRLLSEAASIRPTVEENLPLFAWICVGSIIMQSPAQVDELARLFTEHSVDGFFVTVENFDDRRVDADSLMGLASLAQALEQDHDVFGCSIASFGQVLTALGANGFSAGIGWLETFRETSLQPGGGQFAADRTPRAQYYYVPELLSYIHPDALHDMSDPDSGSQTFREQCQCNCEVCREGLPQEPTQKKRHFMFRRHQEMRELGAVELQARPRYMRDRIERALELCAIVGEEALVQIRTEHFVRWIAVIDALTARQAHPPEETTPEELNGIIGETRRRPRRDHPRP